MHFYSVLTWSRKHSILCLLYDNVCWLAWKCPSCLRLLNLSLYSLYTVYVNTVKPCFIKGNACSGHHSPGSTWWHKCYSTGLLVKTCQYHHPSLKLFSCSYCLFFPYVKCGHLGSGITRGGKGRHLPSGAALWGCQIEVGMLRTNYEMSYVSRC